MKKRLFVALLSVCLLFTLLPATAFAEGEPDSGPPSAQSALCEHHPQHDESCGYTEGTEGSPCSHEHTEDCYALVTECVHEHTAECYPAESVSENTATPSEPGEAEPTACTHECSEESGCITKTLDCKHEHDEACGYVPATEGTLCTYVCEICNAQDSGNPATPSDAQPEECTCETLCTEEEINADCPICSVEGAELDKVCVGAALMLPVTALAVGEDVPGTLWVGQTQITTSGYWKTNSDGTLTTGGAGDDNYNVYYDGNGTLTLNNATIQGGDNVSEQDPQDYGIYASSTTSQSVSLTINLIGTNTVKGVGGIYITSDGNASLVIQSDSDASKGSLEVSGSGTTGIYIVVSGNSSGNPSLTINNASVEASTEKAGYYGVSIVSYTTSSPTLSLTVNGGSLTAQDGIRYVSVAGTNSSNSLTVSDSALIKAIPNISASGASKPTPQAESSSGGIVFEGNSGTVYGNVTLDESLTIEQDETLTIPQGSTLNTNNNLTNIGTIVNTGGTLNGEPGGTIVSAPAITTESLPEGTVDQSYNAELKATGNNITWSSSNLPTWLTLDADTGTISGTPTTDGQFQVTVTATNSVGSIDRTYTLNIKPATVSVTGVNLNKTSLSLTVGGTDTLTATVEPETATDKTVTWESSDSDVATVDQSGNVEAVAPGTANITAKTVDGSHTATCAVTVTQPVTGVTLNPTELSLYTGQSETLAATVTPDTATNKNVTWSSDRTEVATVEDGTVKAVGAGTAIITVTTADGGKTATCTVTVSRYSSGGGSSSSSTSLSDRAIDDIQDARPGDTVEITLRPGRTTLEREVFEELAGQDITLEIDAGDGVLWTVNGLDIPEDTRLHDLDLDVDLGDSGIPATVLNAVTGEIGTVQLSLAHDGQFGFTMTLSAPLGRDNADYWANLYWYNEETEELEFQQAARIAKDGTAEFDLDHASDYAIVIDDRSHEPVDLPFTDVPEGYWAYGAIQYVYGEGLMAGASGTTFAPEGTTTRGQIVTILWRLSGSPQVDYLLDFSDVAGGAYYTEAVRWAVSEGIAGGYGGGVFGPNDPITREQLAVMLHRYAQHEGYDVSIGEDTNILSYTDAFDVSEYAVAALQWACGAGIISGTGDGSTLTPQGEATRAQAATVLMRFCEEYQ